MTQDSPAPAPRRCAADPVQLSPPHQRPVRAIIPRTHHYRESSHMPAPAVTEYPCTPTSSSARFDSRGETSPAVLLRHKFPSAETDSRSGSTIQEKPARIGPVRQPPAEHTL